MLSDELRIRLREMMKNNPHQAVEELKSNPKILELLLSSDDELKKTKKELNSERTKYVNMTSEMQRQLQEKAQQLNVSQGLLIGAGVLWLLSQLDDK